MGSVKPVVKLVRYPDNPQELIAAAARLCYAEDTDALLDQDAEGARKFVRILKKMGHMSPIEHANFTFYIEGVSRAMTHQLVRHRIASYSQRSQRYVSHKGFDYIVPPRMAGKTVDDNGTKKDAEQYYAEVMDYITDAYGKLVQALGDKGESTNEDARYILPNACETKIFVTMNARELIHFFEERLCERAQWEIRDVADQMLALVKEACPAVFSGCGPKCVNRDKCPEGKMTCGKIQEKKKAYA